MLPKYQILSIYIRFNISKDFNMDEFVDKCPFTLSGADFYALASDAMLNAVKRKIQSLNAGTRTLTLDCSNLNDIEK